MVVDKRFQVTFCFVTGCHSKRLNQSCIMLHISFVVRMKLRLLNTNYMEYERQGLN